VDFPCLESSSPTPPHRNYACAKGLQATSVFQQDLPDGTGVEAAFAQGIFSKCGHYGQQRILPLGTADPAPYIQKVVSGKPSLCYVWAGRADYNVPERVSGSRLPD